MQRTLLTQTKSLRTPLSNLQVTKKVEKIISETKEFMLDFNAAAEANVVKANEAISKLSTSHKSEREKMEKLRSGISDDNTTFNSSISMMLTKFKMIWPFKAKSWMSLLFAPHKSVLKQSSSSTQS
ncbi:unnamed protein product [Lactuca saligna]|uniref:Uncharacterized protein n=1 Tax=Lactuca saligna TaxID=75948 RepID=A0AA35UR35_LACSI|nr:unnamed protein product [Lactuca saligna]